MSQCMIFLPIMIILNFICNICCDATKCTEFIYIILVVLGVPVYMHTIKLVLMSQPVVLCFSRDLILLLELYFVNSNNNGSDDFKFLIFYIFMFNTINFFFLFFLGIKFVFIKHNYYFMIGRIGTGAARRFYITMYISYSHLHRYIIDFARIIYIEFW